MYADSLYMGYRRAYWVAVAAPLVIAAILLGQQEGASRGGGDLPAGPPTIATHLNTAVVLDGDPDSNVTLFDLSTASPVFESELPFTEPVVYPDVTALDDGTYVLTALPCREALDLNDGGPDCRPGGLAVAYFDPAEESFRTIKATGMEGSSPYIKVLGSRDNDLILQLDDGFYLLPRDGGDLTALPAPEIDGFNHACLNGDNITVVGRRGSGDTQPDPGELVVEEYGPHVPFEAAAYNLGTGEWRYLGGPTSKYDSLDFFVLDCVESGIVAAPSAPPLHPESPHVTHVLSVDAGGWMEVDPPPKAFVAAAPSTSDGRRTAIAVSHDQNDQTTGVLLFDSTTMSWTYETGGSGGNAAAIALSGDRIITIDASAAELDVSSLRIGT